MDMTGEPEIPGESEMAKGQDITILSAKIRENVPLKLKVKGLGLSEYMRIR